MKTDSPNIETQIIRLADEGVPVGAIARALSRRAEDLWPIIHVGVASGFLVALPAADWPPGSRRTERKPLNVEAKRPTGIEHLLAPLRRIYGLSASEARFLAALVVRREASHETLMTIVPHDKDRDNFNLLAVYACKVRRKLAPFGVTFKSVWAFGYKIAQEDVDAILKHVEQEQAEAVYA